MALRTSVEQRIFLPRAADLLFVVTMQKNGNHQIKLWRLQQENNHEKYNYIFSLEFDKADKVSTSYSSRSLSLKTSLPHVCYEWGWSGLGIDCRRCCHHSPSQTVQPAVWCTNHWYYIHKVTDANTSRHWLHDPGSSSDPKCDQFNSESAVLNWCFCRVCICCSKVRQIAWIQF